MNTVTVRFIKFLLITVILGFFFVITPFLVLADSSVVTEGGIIATATAAVYTYMPIVAQEGIATGQAMLNQAHPSAQKAVAAGFIGTGVALSALVFLLPRIDMSSDEAES